MALKEFPVDKNGHMMRTVQGYWRWDYETRRSVRIIREHELRENTPFTARMSYKGYWRGSSAIVFEWKDENGKIYPMFMSDMNKLVADGALINGSVWGKWRAIKRGGYYGIQLVPEPA